MTPNDMVGDRDSTRLNILLELMSEWMSVMDEQHLLDALPRLKWAFDFRLCVLLLARPDESGLERFVTLHEGSARVRQPAELPGEMVAGLRSAVTEHGFESRQDGGSFLACYPLDSAGNRYGAIGLGSAEGLAFSANETRLVHFTAGCIGSTLDRLAARTAAQAANRRKDEFLALLGHELRNPLAPITTALSLMKLRGVTVREHAVIERQVDHLLRLVDDLLDVSRITEGKIELRRRPVEVSRIVSIAVEMASPLLERRRQPLEIDVPSSGLVIDGDEHRLAQVVSNLLLNASKFSQADARIWLSAERADSRVRICIRDEGVGISAAMLPRVFDLFVQERQPLDRAAGGMGLGLSIVHSLVRLHGGDVRASSRGPGTGSEFIVELPLTASEADAQVRPVGNSGLPMAGDRKRRILVVDDNEDARDTMAALLTRLGCNVLTAADGPDALAIAASTQLDVAIVDIGLPLMDGYELARQLRALEGVSSDLQLIALTGYGQERDRRLSREAGFRHHLVKPVDVDVLTKVLQNPRTVLAAPSARLP